MGGSAVRDTRPTGHVAQGHPADPGVGDRALHRLQQRGGRSDLDQPTPCAMWQVRDVINHILGSATFFAELAETGAVTGREEDEPDFAAGDFSAAFRAAASRLAAAYDAPGLMDQPLEMPAPVGAMPGSLCAWIAASDIFTHGWDLARATGQPTDLEPELAGMLLARVTQTLPDSMRGPEGQAPFGPGGQGGAVGAARRPAGRLPGAAALGQQGGHDVADLGRAEVQRGVADAQLDALHGRVQGGRGLGPGPDALVGG